MDYVGHSVGVRMSDKWNGHPKATGDHYTLGARAWCISGSGCGEYCYPTVWCDCCKEADGWKRLWLTPEGEIVDENLERYR